MMNESNRNGWLIRTTLVGSCGILITVAFSFWAYVQGKFDRYDGLVQERGERIIRLETNYTSIDHQLQEIKADQKEMKQQVAEMYAAIRPPKLK